MLITLLSACLKDVVTTARTEAFFDASRSKREAEIEKRLGKEYPESLREYLATVSSEDFVEDVQALLPVITASHGVAGHLFESTKQASLEEYRLDLPSPKTGSSSKKQVDPAAVELSPEFLSDVRALLREIVHDADERRPNGFVKAFAQALSQEVAVAFSDGKAWSSSSPSEFKRVVEHILATGQSLEVGREIQRFLQDQVNIASPTLQSPLPLSATEQKDMRASLQKRYPGSFPLFEVEPSLGGGIRLFYKGELLDESWMTHIARAFASLRASH